MRVLSCTPSHKILLCPFLSNPSLKLRESTWLCMGSFFPCPLKKYLWVIKWDRHRTHLICFLLLEVYCALLPDESCLFCFVFFWGGVRLRSCFKTTSLFFHLEGKKGSHFLWKCFIFVKVNNLTIKKYTLLFSYYRASLVSQMVKNLPAVHVT